MHKLECSNCKPIINGRTYEAIEGVQICPPKHTFHSSWQPGGNNSIQWHTMAYNGIQYANACSIMSYFRTISAMLLVQLPPLSHRFPLKRHPPFTGPSPETHSFRANTGSADHTVNHGTSLTAVNTSLYISLCTCCFFTSLPLLHAFLC